MSLIKRHRPLLVRKDAQRVDFDFGQLEPVGSGARWYPERPFHPPPPHANTQPIFVKVIAESKKSCHNAFA